MALARRPGPALFRALWSLAAVAAIVGAAVLATPATAALSAKETAALDARARIFAEALRKNDYRTVISLMPPKVIATLAERNEITPRAMQRRLADQAVRAGAGATVAEFWMDTRPELMGDADGLLYASMPSQGLARTADGTPKRFVLKTIAVKDGRRWYLMRVDRQALLDLLITAYPRLAGVEL